MFLAVLGRDDEVTSDAVAPGLSVYGLLEWVLNVSPNELSITRSNGNPSRGLPSAPVFRTHRPED